MSMRRQGSIRSNSRQYKGTSVAGFKDYPTCFCIQKIRVNEGLV